MGNDKAFGIWVVALIAGISSVVTTQLIAGTATMPTFAVVVEHVGMGLLIRAAYKSFDGPYHVFSSVEVPADALDSAASSGGASAHTA